MRMFQACIATPETLAPLVKARGFGMTHYFSRKPPGSFVFVRQTTRDAALSPRKSNSGVEQTTKAGISVLRLAGKATRLEVWPWGVQGGVGQVHPVLNSHAYQIALAAGMRRVVMKKRWD